MAKKIKGKVKEGFICIVKNENRHHFAAEKYLMLYIEEETRKEFPILMTENERNIAKRRAERRKDLIPSGSAIFNHSVRKGHLTSVENKKKKHWFESDFYLVAKITDENNKNYTLMFTDNQFDIIEDRTFKNKEDLIKKGFITDIFD